MLAIAILAILAAVAVLAIRSHRDRIRSARFAAHRRHLARQAERAAIRRAVASRGIVYTMAAQAASKAAQGRAAEQEWLRQG